MNLGLIGDEAIHLTADMEWVENKFLEVLRRAKPDWIVTYDLSGTAQLRKLTERLNEIPAKANLWDVAQTENLAPSRLVLINGFYQPHHCEIALQDTDILAWVDYVVCFRNGQPHSFLDSLRQGKILEINYLEKSEKWRNYNY